MPPYRLRIKRLDFISAVDAGAQGHIANVSLIKRAQKIGKDLACTVAKVDESLGLVFGWAMASSIDGGETPHVDHQDDAIDMSGDDFIKACVEFMETGAAADVMHDGKRDGRVVFAMPLIKQVKDALGIKSDVEGFAIAMKPSPATFKRFQSGELRAFSIGGLGEREPLVTKYLFSRVLKEAVLTSETDGHQHALDLDEPTSEWREMYSTSYQVAAGAVVSHNHTWTFDTATGVITLGSDSGHTHTLDAVVPPDVLAAYLALDAVKDAKNALIAAAPIAVVDELSDGVPMPLAVEESSGATVVVNVNARKPTSKSTPKSPLPTVKAQPETKPMNLAKMLALIVAMTPSQQEHVAKLAPDEVEPFFAKNATERTAILKAADEADAVIFKGALSGIEVRKSDGSKMLELAKHSESTAATLAKREAEIEKSEIRKQAADVLGGMPGDDDTHDFIIASLRKSGDPVKAAKALETLTGMRAETKIGKRVPGIGGVDAPAAITKQSAYVELEKGLLSFAKEKNITKGLWTEGLSAFTKTAVGAELERVYNDACASA